MQSQIAITTNNKPIRNKNLDLLPHDLAEFWNLGEVVLNDMDAYILVQDTQTNEIICANHHFLQDFGENCVGMPCYEALFGEKTTACSLCMAKTKAFDLVSKGGVRLGYPRDQYTHPGNITCLNVQVINGQTIRFIVAPKVSPEKIGEILRHQTYTDPLTNLPNRYKCDEDLEYSILKSKESGQRGYIIFIDMDDFSDINDGYGHDYGDKVIVELSKFLENLVGGEHEVYRFGGDEFTILIKPGYDDSSDELVGEYVNAIIERSQVPWYIGDKNIYTTVSLGVVEFPGVVGGAREVIRNADIALHKAKKQGKNNYVFVAKNVENESIQRIETERLLRESIAADCKDFEVYYQPLVSAKSHRIIGAEALLRWFDKEGRMIGPGEFIPLSEYLGLIIPLGDFVMRESAKSCQFINENYSEDFSMNINVSVRQFQVEGIAEHINSLLLSTGVDFRNVVLEITEGLAVRDVNRLCGICEKLKSKGLRFAMDDFGTGYSSLSNLRSIPLDIIKIDRTFIKDINSDEYSDSFIRLITDLGHTMGRKICIEGVETLTQVEYCVETGVDTIQGFYYSRPVPFEKLISLLKKQELDIPLPKSQ